MLIIVSTLHCDKVPSKQQDNTNEKHCRDDGTGGATLPQKMGPQWDKDG